MPMRRDLVVIGASAGGIDALRSLVAGMRPDFRAAMCVVVHVSPESPGILDLILRRAGRLPALVVRDSERLRPGVVYVPPPDRHIVIEPSVVRAVRGPKENRFRPAVDPLFRSAAQTYGPRAIGVILSGSLDDGTAGLWAVKQLGGIAIVQDPTEAAAASMPRSALAHVDVDHCVSISELPALLEQLTGEDLVEAGGYKVPAHMRIEVKMARAEPALDVGAERLGVPSTYTCPECHGVLRRIEEGGRVRFRCHTGHGYTVESLIADMDHAIEDSLWSAVRALQEKVLLVRHLERHARESGDTEARAAYQQLAAHAQARADSVRSAVLQTEVASAATLASPSSLSVEPAEPNR